MMPSVRPGCRRERVVRTGQGASWGLLSWVLRQRELASVGSGEG